MIKRLPFTVNVCVLLFVWAMMVGCDDATNPPYTHQQIVKPDSFRLAYTPLPTDSVVISEKHVIYLPEASESQDKKIVLLLFDPQGNPEVPIRKYRALADKYSIVLAGTKGSKNGITLNAVIDAGRILIKEIQDRFDSDSVSIYLGGFSGGSQAVFAMAETLPTNGLIYCGTPGNLPSKPIPIMGFAGNMDMNYADLLRFADNIPAANQSLLLKYVGEHAWPKAAVMEAALLWIHCRSIQFNNCSNDVIEKTGQSVSMGLPESIQKVQTAALTVFIKASSGQSTTSEKQQLEALKNSADYKSKIAKENSDIALELNLKDVYTNAIFEKDKSWWTAEIARLRNSAVVNPSNQRLIGFFSLVAYSLSNKALESGDTATTSKILHIYRVADPKNPEQCYLNARYQARIGNKIKTIAYLEEALKNGLIDKEKLTQDDFIGILSEEDIQRLRELQSKK